VRGGAGSAGIGGGRVGKGGVCAAVGRGDAGRGGRAEGCGVGTALATGFGGVDGWLAIGRSSKGSGSGGAVPKPGVKGAGTADTNGRTGAVGGALGDEPVRTLISTEPRVR